MPPAAKKVTQRDNTPKGAVKGSASTSRGSSKTPSKKAAKKAAPRKEPHLLPKPPGEANRKSRPGRPGYMVRPASMLSKQEFKYVKLTVKKWTYKYLDVSKHYGQHSLDDRNKVVQACREAHECLRLYENDWLTIRLMTECLATSTKNYKYEDWDATLLRRKVKWKVAPEEATLDGDEVVEDDDSDDSSDDDSDDSDGDEDSEDDEENGGDNGEGDGPEGEQKDGQSDQEEPEGGDGGDEDEEDNGEQDSDSSQQDAIRARAGPNRTPRIPAPVIRTPPALTLDEVLGSGVPRSKKGKKPSPAAKGSKNKENVGPKKKKAPAAAKSSTASKSLPGTTTTTKSSTATRGKTPARPPAKPLTMQRAEEKKRKRKRAQEDDEEEEVQRPSKRAK
ncbi:hypothetical protein M408DRAFT_333592 [Serendipita vermifera MAFF 305830]|uniref:Uncharacterized protein n=1 Tax=Serendipita vermifera MAFF 305830 TaxID=933852 RepID=A0A0C2W432_SERVB|nr:hypothetical protein M408DRAFT_333592 [Serendipita vermifera MAFF 305830]